MLKRGGLAACLAVAGIISGCSLKSKMNDIRVYDYPKIEVSEGNLGPLPVFVPRGYGKGPGIEEAGNEKQRERGEIYENEMRVVDVYSEDAVDALDITEDDRKRIEPFIQAPWEEVAKAIKTPRDAGAYCLTALTHGGLNVDDERWSRDYWLSGKKAHSYKVVDCDGGGMAAASLLKDDGFPAYLLCIEGITRVVGNRGAVGNRRFGHALWIYKTKTGIGSIGINQHDVRAPTAANLDIFITGLANDMGDEIESFKIYDIGALFPDYDVNDRNNNPRMDN